MGSYARFIRWILPLVEASGCHSSTSVWLKEVSCGTEVKILQEGIPSAIPVEFCYLG